MHQRDALPPPSTPRALRLARTPLLPPPSPAASLAAAQAMAQLVVGDSLLVDDDLWQRFAEAFEAVYYRSPQAFFDAWMRARQ